jgi:hypothetical protein
MTAETFTCIVCGESDERESLFEYCNGCGELYHFNRTNGPGKDCGDAWIEDEEVGLQFFCNTCMERQKAEDQEQMAELARAAASGTLTPELVAQAMQALSNQAGASTPFLSGFPGLAKPQAPAPGTGVPPMPEPISGAELRDKLGMAVPGDADAPTKAPTREAPPLRRSPRKTARRYRRIE